MIHEGAGSKPALAFFDCNSCYQEVDPMGMTDLVYFVIVIMKEMKNPCINY